ncbi:S9 family peptidase [Tenacibaculum sp. SZ-18]|uniref:S9 family peptidase n=1 Tax=Tenacibaculum sp. SZ-18 TaxID=754423 RepID=UPI000C2D08C6|nr:alpha/beta fold hydrolase [Tenacibaculum sp. SZ-18]AUC14287.1 S9 family peptidase [Tenacibaculum sp. SZ-18]
MKNILLLTFFTGLLLVSCKESKKEELSSSEKIKQYSIKQMMDNESVFGGSFSSDNSKLLVTSNKSGIYNMYTVNTKDGTYTPITQSDSSSVYATSYFPKDDRMLFRMDDNGDEIYHIYKRDLDGTITELTPGKGVRSNFYGWSKDEKSFFYGSNKRDPKYMDIYEMDLKTFTPNMIYENKEGYDVSAISNNKQLFALNKTVNTNDSDLFLYNVSTKETIKINETISGNSAEDFSNDDKFLYYTTDANGEFTSLMKYDLQTKESTQVLKKDWDISGSYFTNKGNYRVTYINEDAKNVIEVQNVATGKNIELPSVNGKSITNVGFSRDETKLRFYAGGSNSPSNLYVYDLKSKEQKQLTNVLNDEINEEDLVSAKVIRYPSFDGVTIPAIYYLPHQASADNKVPALVWVHGGPGGQSRQNFNSRIQYLVNHGYAVLAVNNRGSSGYGKTFYKMDDKNHGEKDLQDCVEGKKWLAKQAEIDDKKIGIIGGSYGGYMTMAALTYTPEEFAVGVNIYGVTNWMRTLKSIPPWWESFREALYKELGNPHSADSVRLKKISPLFHTDKVTKPLMVLQGAKDPRVLQVESDEIVAGVKKNGVPVEYVLFEDEGHGFAKKENQIEANSKILKFLDEYLKKNKPLEKSAL